MPLTLDTPPLVDLVDLDADRAVGACPGVDVVVASTGERAQISRVEGSCQLRRAGRAVAA